jgi:hypothetical protein
VSTADYRVSCCAAVPMLVARTQPAEVVSDRALGVVAGW